MHRFVVSFCLGGVYTYPTRPLPTHSVSRAFGVVFLCVPPCVYFSRVGVGKPLSVLCALTYVFTFFAVHVRWQPRPCLAVWAWTSCDRCRP